MNHLADNFKKAYRNSTLTKLYWKATRALSISNFDECMAKIKSANAEAYDWIMLQHLIIWAYDGMYEINADKKYAVNLATHACNCRVWQFSGLSCSHAIAVIDHRNEDVIEFCGVYFTVQMCGRSYSLPFNPMSDALELPDIVYTTVMPPTVRRTVGRPKKRHRQTEYKVIRPLKCNRCRVVGHNRKTSKSSI
ncbi:hypothetical protein AMTR_s00084p00086880 [Amborella trichopoda]|uniref:SWIM-type domain-containing protein n=1 Tax=Amborella trichopoda TaxID=13333 RepID=W1P5R0_AMBTC|nr:hypothetical protein AMTR_s00084p00086880 [Amborella trichopoda]